MTAAPELTARYAQMRAALMARDLGGLLATMAPDWQGVSPDGSVTTLAEFAEALGQFFASGVEILRYDVTFEALTLEGETAQVTFLERNARRVPEEGGGAHVREVVSRTRETWRRTAEKGWLAVRSEPLELLEAWIDGERVIYREPEDE